MKLSCKFACTSILVLSSLSFLSAPAVAQKARGTFTLNHDVHWQGEMVPAGDYNFSVEMWGSSEMLRLRSAGGDQSTFMILVNDADLIAPTAAAMSEKGKLTLTSQSGERYVTSMDVPAVGMSLHFSAPAEVQALGTSNHGSSAAK